MSTRVVAPDELSWSPPIDRRRGRAAMWLFILSEAVLFLMLFFAYFYLRHNASIWGLPKPSLKPAFLMLGVLTLSSVVLHVGQHGLHRGHQGRARLMMVVTIILGFVFLVLQGLEFRDRLREIRPSTNAYGSIFYTITSIHGLHVALGMAMLGWVLVLPDLVSADRPPHDPYETAALYWHFVDVVWVVIVAILYVGPNLTP
jgi:heme/copper-type cytochrome/quinol oxidase subunit 3